MVRIIICNLEDYGKADVICHQVNCMGKFGSGCALSIKNKYPEVYREYAKACETNDKRSLLGKCLICKKNDGGFVANIFGQYKYGRDGKQYTEYRKLESGLIELRDFMRDNGLKSVAFPYKIGCGLGGGNWEIVSGVIEDIFKDFEIVFCKK